jgi:hypothetical protein
MPPRSPSSASASPSALERERVARLRAEVELMELKLANAQKAASPRKYRLTPITPRKSRSSSNSPRSSPHSPKVRSAPFGAASDSPERRPQSS